MIKYFKNNITKNVYNSFNDNVNNTILHKFVKCINTYSSIEL